MAKIIYNRRKITLKTNLKKTLKIRPGYLFLQFWPPNGSLRGGVKMVPRASLWDHFSPMLGPIWCKHTKKCNLQWETKPNIYTKTSDFFWKLASVSSCVSLYLGWFCVQSTAHEGMEAQGGIGRPKSVFWKLASLPSCFWLHFEIDSVCRVRHTARFI